MKRLAKVLAAVAGAFLVYLAWLVSAPGLPPGFRQTLESAEDLELVSLGNQIRGSFDSGPGRYEGRPVLGTARLDAESRRNVLKQIDRQVRWARVFPVQAMCHYPHHLLRTKGQGCEISLCFLCRNFYAHQNGKLVVGGCLSGQPDVYNEIFRRQGVTLPPERETF